MNKNIEHIEEYLDELLENKFQSIKEQNLNIEIKKIYFQKHLDESISIDKLFLNLSLGALAFLSTLIFKIDFKNIIDTWNILSIIFGSASALLFLCVVDAELFEIMPKNKALMLLIVGKSNIYDEPSEEEKKII